MKAGPGYDEGNIDMSEGADLDRKPWYQARCAVSELRALVSLEKNW